MARSDEPARGERDAQTGYYPQYKLSAEIVVRSIRRPDLLWIAIADPKAGRVDDFQIAAGREAKQRSPEEMRTALSDLLRMTSVHSKKLLDEDRLTALEL